MPPHLRRVRRSRLNLRLGHKSSLQASLDILFQDCAPPAVGSHGISARPIHHRSTRPLYWEQGPQWGAPALFSPLLLKQPPPFSVHFIPHCFPEGLQVT
ncbi:hypothetical protein CgunFtcFv8_021878 [Champsocephalus gunnari]|uniref:Uncharacterized protein n=1 Tax=Champsocephalus gunnari TaxID=52237 RepID=A0AAN8DQA0_CHAGU|nr:hypothetical protein CgunFtcFv8_021878 [Champsocephalus gunnari]